MKRKLTASIITICLILAACLSVAACTPTESEPQAYVSLDINPSIELTLDSENKVLSVHGANEDGQVLLYGEEGIVGLKVDAAVEKITELAIELGYLDEDNKVVQTNVVADSGEDAILSQINAKVTATADKLNLNVTCQGADAYSLARRLENLKAQYPNNEAIQSLTPSKLKLVVAANETGEISIEAAAELDVSELVTMVSDAHTQLTDYATTAYNKAKSVADGIYQKAKAAAVDSIYTTYFALHRPLDSYYASAYQGYKLSAVSMRALADVLFYAEQAIDYPLNEAQIAAVSEALGLGENVDALKNSQGEITIRSIEAYADKLFKNSETAAELAEIKAKLTQALNSAESTIQAEIDEFKAEYQTEIEQIKTILSDAIDSIKSLEALVPSAIKQQLTSFINDMNEILSKVTEVISDGKITSDEVRALADDLDAKATAARKIIDSKLTDEDREEIAKLQQKAEESLTSAKAQFDSAVAQAETEAKAYLQQLKDARASK